MISIIVPVYNAESYIERCLNSLVGQTYRDLQIIVVDDGSADKSGAICDEFAKNDSRITVIHQAHKGPSEARNAGLRVAEGEYIGFADADDWCEPEMFSQLLNAVQENSADAARCNFRVVKEDSSYLYVPNPKSEKILSGREAVTDSSNHFVDSGYGTAAWNTLFRADIAKKPELLLFPLGMHWGEDSDWLRRALIRCKSVVMLTGCYYNYNKYNKSSCTNNKTYNDYILSIDSKLRFFKEYNFPEEDIIRELRLRNQVVMYMEINDYIKKNRCDTPTIKKTSIIKDILMKEKWTMGTMKISLTSAMVKLRMPPKMVKKVWRLSKQ